MDPTPPQESPDPPALPAHERRLRAKLRAGEDLAAWGRAWVSRDGTLHTLFAARTLDFLVLTDDHLIIYSTGFFSRRPRRRVFDIPLDRLTVDDRQGGAWRRLRLWTRSRRALLLELRVNPRNTAFSDALVARIDTGNEE